MTAKEIRELSVAEIGTKLNELRAELLQLRLRKGSGQLEKPHLLRALRKDIARLLTVQTAKLKAAPAATR
jgi:large subunit ribosomal protein L29